MKKNIWLAAGIAGMLLGNPFVDAQAEVSIQRSTGSRPSFVINSAPSFIYLRGQGFSVSVGNPYDIVYYGNLYYIYNHGRWYRSSNYHGPWILVLNNRIPYQIRRHSWEDIRRYRDIEYSKSESRNSQYQRNDDNKRRILDQRNDAENKRVQDQKNRDSESKRVLEQKNKDAEDKRVQDQKNQDVESRRVRDQKNKDFKSN
jgi:hypothetical protein